MTAANQTYERFRLLCLYDGGQGNLPTAWKLFERLQTEDGPKSRLVCEGPGETAELIEALVNAYANPLPEAGEVKWVV